jgi:hypothetical protein
MQAVFDYPMAADHWSDLVREQHHRGDLWADFAIDRVADFARALDHDDALQTGPVVLRVIGAFPSPKTPELAPMAASPSMTALPSMPRHLPEQEIAGLAPPCEFRRSL